MNDTYILAIETSCDETSMAIVKNGNEVLSSVVLTQMDIHKAYGGVVPEIASRKHIENITMVLEEVLTKIDFNIKDINYIAVTVGPGLIGSLLIGVEAAKTISMVYDIPIIKTHHLKGHIFANNLVDTIEYPLIALVISGGHTEYVLMENKDSYKILGTTLDDAVGETYDKVARVLGLPYPGGPEIDKAAEKGTPTYELPFPLNDGTPNFSFSGLKSATINLKVKEELRGKKIDTNNFAASFQKKIEEIFLTKTNQLLQNYNIKTFTLAGGVAANKGIRETLEKLCTEKNIKFLKPPMKYCTDNASMIGAAAFQEKEKSTKDLSFSAISSISIEKDFK